MELAWLAPFFYCLQNRPKGYIIHCMNTTKEETVENKEKTPIKKWFPNSLKYRALFKFNAKVYRANSRAHA